MLRCAAWLLSAPGLASSPGKRARALDGSKRRQGGWAAGVFRSRALSLRRAGQWAAGSGPQQRLRPHVHPASHSWSFGAETSCAAGQLRSLALQHTRLTPFFAAVPAQTRAQEHCHSLLLVAPRCLSAVPRAVSPPASSRPLSLPAAAAACSLSSCLWLHPLMTLLPRCSLRLALVAALGHPRCSPTWVPS